MAGTERYVRNSTADFLVFTKDSETDGIEVRVQDHEVWLTQKGIGQLFDVDRSVVAKHLRNIFAENELSESTTCAKFAQVADNGKTFTEGQTVQASVLFRTYLNWCSENNEKWRMANKQFGMEVKKHYEIRKGMYYNEYVDMALSDEGMRCMALGRGTEPSVAPARSRPLYEQTRLKN